MKAATALLLTLALTGCATCRNHPTACAAVTLIAAGSLALSAGHSHQHEQEVGRIGPPLTPDCNRFPEMCR